VLDEVEGRVDRLIDAALDDPVDARRAFDHVFDADTPRLAAQRADLASRHGEPTEPADGVQPETGGSS